MLTGLRIGNFKAFADVQSVPIRPLTLIFGANSSGKSSILHSLLLAKEVHEGKQGTLDVFRTDAGGDSVDLGGFRQYVHRRNPENRVSWAVELDSSRFAGRLGALAAPVKQMTVSVTFGLPVDDEGRPNPDAHPQVETYELTADGAGVLRMSRRRDGTMRVDTLEHQHVVFREVLKAIVETALYTESVRPADYDELATAIGELTPELSARIDRILPAGVTSSRAPTETEQQSLFPMSRGNRAEDLAAALRFFIPRTMNELVGGIAEVAATELRRVHYLGPLRSYPPRHLAFAQYHDPNWFAGGGHAWDVVRREPSVRVRINEWLGLAERLQTPYELVVRELFADETIEQELPARLFQALRDLLRRAPLPPADDPKREPIAVALYEAFIDRTKQDDIEQNIESLTPQIEAFISQTTDPDETVRQWVREAARRRRDPLQDLMLLDKRTGTPVSHRDVGIGISQVLPVLVLAYASNKEIIGIEQPEIHLHPKLQAELGDVLIESALGSQGNTFILETHSEHLILRILRRIREASREQNAGRPAVRPADVSLLFVAGTKAGSTVQQLRVDERGRLLDPVPGGFFEEGFEELF